MFSSKHRSSDNQLKETLKHLNELKVTHDFLQDSNKNLIESKIQLENDKEDLQVSKIIIICNITYYVHADDANLI